MNAFTRRWYTWGAIGSGVIVVVVIVLFLTVWDSSGSSKKAATPTTPPSGATTTTTLGTSSRLAQHADQLCAEADVVEHDLANIDLAHPTSLAKAPGVISKDLKALRDDMTNVSAAGHSNGEHPQIGPIVADYNKAVTEAKSALTSVEAGNLGMARTDLTAAGNDLTKTRTALTKLNLGACATTPTTT